MLAPIDRVGRIATPQSRSGESEAAGLATKWGNVGKRLHPFPEGAKGGAEYLVFSTLWTGHWLGHRSILNSVSAVVLSWPFSGVSAAWLHRTAVPAIKDEGSSVKELNVSTWPPPRFFIER